MKKLINPKTENYFKFKEFILSDDFPWHFNGSVVGELGESQNTPNANWSYSHSILDRPEHNHFHSSAILHAGQFVETISEIFDYNQIPNYLFLRMNVNATHPVTTESRIGFYHSDHDFKHENFILYLTPTDGATMIEGVPYTPIEEDECITFTGSHANQFPTYGRRIVIVATYITFDVDISYKERCAQLQSISH